MLSRILPASGNDTRGTGRDQEETEKEAQEERVRESGKNSRVNERRSLEGDRCACTAEGRRRDGRGHGESGALNRREAAYFLVWVPAGDWATLHRRTHQR